MRHRSHTTMAGSVVFTGLLVSVVVAQTVRPMPVLHDLAGRDNCLMCHEAGAMEPVTDVPPTHAGRENVTCLWCHADDSPLLTTDPPVVTHDLAGRDDCLMCHAPGAMEPITDTPPSHEGRDNPHCMMCHTVAP